MGMLVYIVGLAGFFGLHAFSALRRRGSNDIRARMGEGRYLGLYSVAALLFFLAVFWGYDRAPRGEPLWYSHAAAHASWMVVWPALVLITAAYTPLGYIKAIARHPMMLGILVWAGAHLLVGGDLVKVLLFGSFAAYAVLSLGVAYARGNRPQGTPSWRGDAWAFVIGTLIFGALMHGGHRLAFGVSPFG